MSVCQQQIYKKTDIILYLLYITENSRHLDASWVDKYLSHPY